MRFTPEELSLIQAEIEWAKSDFRPTHREN
jgi:hypothetical protein